MIRCPALHDPANHHTQCFLIAVTRSGAVCDICINEQAAFTDMVQLGQEIMVQLGQEIGVE